jgi:hypothetical protein
VPIVASRVQLDPVREKISTLSARASHEKLVQVVRCHHTATRVAVAATAAMLRYESVRWAVEGRRSACSAQLEPVRTKTAAPQSSPGAPYVPAMTVSPLMANGPPIFHGELAG